LWNLAHTSTFLTWIRLLNGIKLGWKIRSWFTLLRVKKPNLPKINWEFL